MNRRALFLTVWWVALLIPVSMLQAQPVSRTVIALYDGKGDGAGHSVIQRLAEMPLNHLGLVVRYLDANGPLPEPSEMDDVRGVLVWEIAGVDDPGRFLEWAQGVMDSGRRLIMIGGFGDDDSPPLVKIRDAVGRFWKRLGLREGHAWIPFTYNSQIVYRDPAMVDFERRIDGVLPGYERLNLIDGVGQSFLKIRQKGSGKDSDLVVITPAGGWIASGYLYFHDDATDTTQWYVNPFEFFRRALGTDELPKPDTTTLAGRRIFFSHIDGDGWNNLTEIYPFKNRGILASEVVKEEIIKAYPELPVTVSPIAGDLDPAWHGNRKSLRVAREILALPQVEAGCHTYSHPFDWEFFADGDAEKERPFLKLYSKPWGKPVTLRRAADAEKRAYYQATGYVTPRAYAVEPFDLALEVGGAVRFINSLLPEGKSVQVYQWSGDTSPFPAAIEATRRLGIRNINGGDTRLDRKYPSYSWVSPLGRSIGGQIQVYASNSNENTYTDQWSEQFFGYRHLIRTLDNTEMPLRVKPIGVYYHMYSGQKLSSLNAVRANLDYARSQPIIPITTSRYAAIADGFYTVRLTRSGKRQWLVEDRQALQTLRFDRAIFSAVDFERSRGVLGQYHFQGSLYIALDSAVAKPVVALRDSGESFREPSAEVPYLIGSNWRVWGLQRRRNSFTFDTAGFGEGRMVWKVPKEGVYLISMAGKDGAIVQKRITVAAEKRLRFAIDSKTPDQTVRVHIDYRRETV